MKDEKHMFWHPNQAHPYLDMDFYRQGRPTAAPEHLGIMSRSPLRWLHFCFKRITGKRWWERGGQGEGMRGRHGGGQRGAGRTAHGRRQLRTWVEPLTCHWPVLATSSPPLGLLFWSIFHMHLGRWSTEIDHERRRPSCPGSSGKSVARWNWNLGLPVLLLSWPPSAPTSFKIYIQNLMTCIMSIDY